MIILNISANTMKDMEAIDRCEWNKMLCTMNDVSKFVDMMHNVPWENGLPSDVLQGECHFANLFFIHSASHRYNENMQ